MPSETKSSSLKQATPARTYSRPGGDTPSAPGAATILVVDDDPAMRMIVSLSLRLYGYVVLVAGSGKEGLDVAREHPEIRVIILDVIMAGLAGKELADKLKTSVPEAAILYCSGHPAAALAGYGVAADAANFLQKPCRAPDLQQKIEELIASR